MRWGTVKRSIALATILTTTIPNAAPRTPTPTITTIASHNPHHSPPDHHTQVRTTPVIKIEKDNTKNTYKEPNEQLYYIYAALFAKKDNTVASIDIYSEEHPKFKNKRTVAIYETDSKHIYFREKMLKEGFAHDPGIVFYNYPESIVAIAHHELGHNDVHNAQKTHPGFFHQWNTFNTQVHQQTRKVPKTDTWRRGSLTTYSNQNDKESVNDEERFVELIGAAYATPEIFASIDKREYAVMWSYIRLAQKWDSIPKELDEYLEILQEEQELKKDTPRKKSYENIDAKAKAFLEKYPHSIYAQRAWQKRIELVDKQRTTLQDTITDIYGPHNMRMFKMPMLQCALQATYHDPQVYSKLLDQLVIESKESGDSTQYFIALLAQKEFSYRKKHEPALAARIGVNDILFRK